MACRPEVQARISALTQYLQSRGADLVAAQEQAIKMIDNMVRKESFVMAFNDAFLLVGVLLLCSVVAIMLLKKPEVVDAAGAH